MKYIKKYEIVDYDEPDYDMKEYSGPVYLYTDKPATKEDIDKYRIYMYNRADASDTQSEYIYQIKLKKPLYKKDLDFFGFDSMDDILSGKKVPDKTSEYSGYFYNAITSEILVKITNPEDIISFKLIGGFIKYDKNYPEKVNIELSEETEDFLYSYIGGTILHKKLTPQIKKELEQFKPKESIKIYKGIEEVQIKYNSNIKPPYHKGQIIKANFSHFTSWTTNVLIARRFIDDYPSSTPFVVMMIAKPEDILVDVRLLPGEYYHTNQREIIMMPNADYEFKIVWEGQW